MTEQITIQNLLNQKLVEARAKNPQYSIRAFATKLGVASGPLSQILSGQRRISKKMASKICDRLMLNPIERETILMQFERYKNLNTEGKLGDRTGTTTQINQLTADQFKVISEWFYYAILCLVQTSNFKNDSLWISKRLGISTAQASQATQRLIRLGYLEKASNGKLVRSKIKIQNTDDVVNLSQRKAHFETLELAKASLEKDAVTDRDFTTISFPADLTKMTQAKALIRDFEKKLAKLMMTPNQTTEVYRVSVELFPLTKISTKNT